MPLLDSLLKQAIVDGIIDPDFHDQLLVKVGQFTRTAGISEEDLLLRLSHHCGEREQSFFREWKKLTAEGCYGLLYVGSFKPKGVADVGLRMRSLTAAFMRNYIDARIRRTEKAIEESCTVLCLSDFGVEPSDYIKQRIAPMILARATEAKPTILHVADKSKIKTWWGQAVADLLTDSYAKVSL